ncbi:MAG: NAD(P)-dependent oxidoreductase [Pseudomonadota bacterium]
MSERIVVAQPIEAGVLQELQEAGTVFVNSGPEPMPRNTLLDKCRSAEALMAFMTECIDADFLDACPKLKIVAGALKGFDNIDVDACSKRGIAVSVVPDLLTEPTAELAIGLMIAVSRHMIEADRYVREGHFSGWRPRFFGGSLQGATVGVVGAGRVGQAILRLLSGFRTKSLYFDRHALSPDTERALNTRRADLAELQVEADFVVLALPLTPETIGLVDEAFIEGMKRGAYLINPARGSLVTESAVAAALQSGHLAGFAADVFEAEDWARSERPAVVDPVLRQSPYTVLTPHIGSAVTDVRREITRSAAHSILAVLNGERPDTLINSDDIREMEAC